MTCANTEDETFELYTKAKSIFCDGGFNLRKFCTNSTQLQQRIDHTEQLCTLKGAKNDTAHLDETYIEFTLGDSQGLGTEEQKVLGMCWRPSEDRFVFDISTITNLACNLEPTKRNVISIIGKFYDPLGFLAPVMIRFKIFFQKLCGNKVSWDQPLPDELTHEWKTLVNDLCKIAPISIPRSYLAGKEGIVISYCLYGFCDASTRAYAAVVYLALSTEEDTMVSFVATKT